MAGAIIQPSMPAMPVIWTAVMLMPEPSSTQAQASAITIDRPTSTTSRSRRNTASSMAVRLWPAVLLLILIVAMDQSLRTPGNVSHRAMPAVQVEPDRAGTLGEAGDVLGLVKLPPPRQHRDHPVLGVGGGGAGRLAVRADCIGHLDPGTPPVQNPIQKGRGEQ